MTADQLLEEWGRWARSGDPTQCGADGAPVAICPLFEWWIPSKGWDAAWGDPDASPEPFHVSPDELRCERTDRLIMRLAVQHVLTIKRHYYNHRRVTWEDIGSALRAFADLEAV